MPKGMFVKKGDQAASIKKTGPKVAVTKAKKKG